MRRIKINGLRGWNDEIRNLIFSLYSRFGDAPFTVKQAKEEGIHLDNRFLMKMNESGIITHAGWSGQSRVWRFDAEVSLENA